MFDKEKTGSIGLSDFQALYNYINAWLGVFRGFDHDNSGSIQENELSAALTQMGYRFSPDFVKYLLTKSDFNQHQSITVDQFIVVCVQIQKFTGKLNFAMQKNIQSMKINYLPYCFFLFIYFLQKLFVLVMHNKLEQLQFHLRIFSQLLFPAVFN